MPPRSRPRAPEAAAPAAARQPAQEPLVRRLSRGTTVVNLLGTANADKPPGAKGRSWIAYYRDTLKARDPYAGHVCCVEGCSRIDSISGGHVKIASGPTAAALLHTKWYIVPTCPAHNKRSSCKTMRVKPGVWAVEATPGVVDRLTSWPADITKLVRTMMGKR